MLNPPTFPSKHMSFWLGILGWWWACGADDDRGFLDLLAVDVVLPC